MLFQNVYWLQFNQILIFLIDVQTISTGVNTHTHTHIIANFLRCAQLRYIELCGCCYATKLNSSSLKDLLTTLDTSKFCASQPEF